MRRAFAAIVLFAAIPGCAADVTYDPSSSTESTDLTASGSTSNSLVALDGAPTSKLLQLAGVGSTSTSFQNNGAASIPQQLSLGAEGFCDGPWAIYSPFNHNFVSVEFADQGDDYRMLRARNSFVGPWEQFGRCTDSAGTSWFSWNHVFFVSVELGFQGTTKNGNPKNAMLRARATSVGAWEKYHLYATQTGGILLQSQANSLFVAGEMAYKGGDEIGMLRARTPQNALGAWEIFELRPQF